MPDLLALVNACSLIDWYNLLLLLLTQDNIHEMKFRKSIQSRESTNLMMGKHKAEVVYSNEFVILKAGRALSSRGKTSFEASQFACSCSLAFITHFYISFS